MSVEIVEFLLSGFTDNSGEPLAAGKVYTYAAGTSTPKDTYVDSDKDPAHANPIILDSNGRKQVYAEGAYKFEIKTAADVLLYTFDNLFFGNAGSVINGGTSSGSANVYTVTPSPAPSSYSDGDLFSFKAHQTNITTATFNAGGGAKTLTDVPGQIVINRAYLVRYIEATDRFMLVNPDPAEAFSQADMAALNTAGVGEIVVRQPITMTGNLTLTVPLTILAGGLITTSTHTLTINAGFTAPKKKVFATTNTVIFGQNSVSEILPEWFGAIADDSTDNNLFLAAALASVPTYGTLKLGSGIYRGWLRITRSNISIIGEGSGSTTLKLPNSASYSVTNEAGATVSGTPIVLDLGETSRGNNATAYSNVTVRGLSLDGNSANVTLPTTDIFGWGLTATAYSHANVSDVKSSNCHLGGVGFFINSNYAKIQATVISCGEATLGAPGFDINSSKFGIFDFISKSCRYGGRLLDNCWNNQVRGVIEDAVVAGFLHGNQLVNHSENNVFNLTIMGGVTSDAVQIGANCRNSIWDIVIKNSAAGGLQLVHQASSANHPSGHIIRLCTYNTQQKACVVGGDHNHITHQSYLDGLQGAQGDYHAIEIVANSNAHTISLDMVDSSTWKTRTLLINSGALKNNIVKVTRSDDLNLLTDTGTGTIIDHGRGSGDTIVSAAGINIPLRGESFSVSGTVNIGSITASNNGRIIYLSFQDVLTVTDGSNLKLAGNLVTTAGSTLTLLCDGTNWYELARAVV